MNSNVKEKGKNTEKRPKSFLEEGRVFDGTMSISFDKIFVRNKRRLNNEDAITIGPLVYGFDLLI